MWNLYDGQLYHKIIRNCYKGNVINFHILSKACKCSYIGTLDADRIRIVMIDIDLIQKLGLYRFNKFKNDTIKHDQKLDVNHSYDSNYGKKYLLICF